MKKYLYSKKKMFSDTRGFSLAEVMVAVGVFAFSIVGIVGLLGSAGKGASSVSEVDDANRVAAAVQAEVQRMGIDMLLAGEARNQPFLRTSQQTLEDDAEPDFNPASTSGPSGAPKRYTLFADRTGTRIGLMHYTSSGTEPVWDDEDPGGSGSHPYGYSRKFFEITLIRNEEISPQSNDNTAGFLAYTMRIRWPSYLPNAVRVKDNSQKQVLYIPGVVLR